MSLQLQQRIQNARNTHFAQNISQDLLSGAQYHNECLEHLRRAVYTTLDHAASDVAIVFLVVLNAVAVVSQKPNPPDDYQNTSLEETFMYLDIVTTVIFVIELMLRVFGETPRCFLKNSMNWYESFVVLACLGALFVQYIPGVFAAMRALRLLVLVKNVKLFKGLKPVHMLCLLRGWFAGQVIIAALSYNLRFVANVMILILIWYSIFSQIGIECFYGSLKRRCVAVDTGLASLAPERYCGTDGKGYQCTSTQYCDFDYGNPNNGFTSFDNTAATSLILFQITTVSSWFNFVYALMDSEYKIAAGFPLIVYLLVSLVSTSLFIAVVTHGFSEFRENQKVEESLALCEEMLELKIAAAVSLVEAEAEQEEEEWAQNSSANTSSSSLAPPDLLSETRSTIDTTARPLTPRRSQNQRFRLPKMGDVEQMRAAPIVDEVSDDEDTNETVKQPGATNQSWAGAVEKVTVVNQMGNEEVLERRVSMWGTTDFGASTTDLDFAATSDTEGVGTSTSDTKEIAAEDLEQASLHNQPQQDGAPPSTAPAESEIQLNRAESEIQLNRAESLESMIMNISSEGGGKDREKLQQEDQDSLSLRSPRNTRPGVHIPTNQSWQYDPTPDEVILIGDIVDDQNPDQAITDIEDSYNPDRVITDISSSGSGVGSGSGVSSAQQKAAQVTLNPSIDKPEGFSQQQHKEASDTDSDSENPEPPSVCRRFRKPFFWIVQRRWFQRIIIVLILVNTLMLASVYDNMSLVHENIVDGAEYFFAVAFGLEALLKMVGLGLLPGYFSRWANVFDFVIVLCSIVGLIWDNGAFAALRVFRVFRILRVLRRFRSLQRILDSVLHSLTMVLNVFLLLFLIFCAYALMGVSLFGNLFTFEGCKTSDLTTCQYISDYKAANFDNFYRAILTLFVVMTADGWEKVLYMSMDTKHAWIAPLYFVSFMMITVFIVLNLLVAAILENLQVSDALNEQRQLSKQDQQAAEPEIKADSDSAPLGNDNTSTTATEKAEEAWSCIALRGFCQGFVRLQGVRIIMLLVLLLSCVVLAFHKKGDKHVLVSATEVFMVLLFSLEIGAKILANGWTEKVPSFHRGWCLAKVHPEEGERADEESLFCGWQMPLFTSRLTDVEVTEPFRESVWNILDLLILGCCAFDLLLLMSGWTAAVFVLRPLRALRIVSQLNSLQRVVYTLLQAIPMLLQIVIFIVCLLGVFAILGVTLFVSKFSYCTDLTMENGTSTISSKDECIGYFEDSSSGSTVLVPRAWVKYDQSFNNIGYAMLSLFEVSSCDNWNEMMYNAVNIAGIDKQPIIGESEANAYFFIAFIFLSSMFVFQMFVAVVCDSFFHAHGYFDRTDEQSQLRNLLNLLEMLLPEELPPTPAAAVEGAQTRCGSSWTTFRLQCYYLVSIPGPDAPNYSRAVLFDRLLTASLIVNVLFLLTLHHPSSDSFVIFYETQNIIFLGLYWIEALIKITAHGWHYFRDQWNWLDIAVCLGSTIAELPMPGQIEGRYFRLFRTLRVVRLFRKYLPVYSLLRCMWRAITNVSSVLVVLLTIYYIFAVIGVQLFAHTKFGWHLNASTNFQSFGRSFLTLFNISSGEFVGLYYDCVISSPKCVRGSDCGSVFTRFYFCIFYVLTAYVTYQLFLAVVIESFQWAYALEDRGQANSSITAKHVELYTAEFAKYDPMNTGFIAMDDVKKIVTQLSPPLGHPDPGMIWMRVLRHELRVLGSHGQVSCNGLFLVLAVKLYGVQVVTEDTVIDQNLTKGLQNSCFKKPAYRMLKTAMETTREVVSLARMMDKSPNTQVINDTGTVSGRHRRPSLVDAVARFSTSGLLAHVQCLGNSQDLPDNMISVRPPEGSPSCSPSKSREHSLK